MSVRTRLEHRWTQRHLSDYIDERLNTRQRARLEAHASICPECGPLVRRLLWLVSSLQALRNPPRRSVAPAVIERLRAQG